MLRIFAREGRCRDDAGRDAMDGWEARIWVRRAVGSGCSVEM